MISRQAITRMQSLAVLTIILSASLAGIWFYTQSIHEDNPSKFSMEVISRPFIPLKGENQIPIAIVGQNIVFLVTVEDTLNGNESGDVVEVSATCSGALVSVNNPKIKPREVAEVNVIPTHMSVNKILTLNITGNMDGFKKTETFDIEVLDRQDSLGETASEIRDLFIPWLTENHPEFEITDKTEWKGSIVNPGILVVMHHLFLSEDWELYVTWHVMIPPYDWARIYLRPRFSETQSTSAFEISSLQEVEDPHSIELPDWL